MDTHPLATRAARARFNKTMREKGVPAKVCGTCWTVNGHEAFAADRSAPDGRQARCKVCVAEHKATYRADPEVRQRAAEYNRAWYTANRARRAVYNAARWADPEYRQRRAETDLAWAQANPDKVRAKSQRRRALKAQATVQSFTPADLAEHYEDLAAYECSVCGLPMTPPDDNTDEHVVPLANGGAHALGNLLPAHFACNSSKHTTPALEAWKRRTAWVGRHDPDDLLTLANRLTSIQAVRHA